MLLVCIIHFLFWRHWGVCLYSVGINMYRPTEHTSDFKIELWCDPAGYIVDFMFTPELINVSD